jgi:hypothetical protein
MIIINKRVINITESCVNFNNCCAGGFVLSSVDYHIIALLCDNPDMYDSIEGYKLIVLGLSNLHV